MEPATDSLKVHDGFGLFRSIYVHRFGGVVVITSALHAEGPGFNPRSNLSFESNRSSLVHFNFNFLFFHTKRNIFQSIWIESVPNQTSDTEVSSQAHHGTQRWQSERRGKKLKV